MGKSSRNRDLVAVCEVTLFYLMCVSYATSPVCEKLVHPLDQLGPHQSEGRWALVAGSLNHSSSMEALRQRDSITMYFSNSSKASTLSYTQINRFGDQCQYLPYNISVEGSTFTFDVQNRFNLSMAFLYTSCPDCVVMRWLVKSRRRISTDLYLMSRRREVEQKEMEEFRAQLKCYQLPEPVVMDPTKELCPEQPENQPTGAAAAQTVETVGLKA
uniref:Uncharacterized protein n=1 Tax=Amphilophus citrinellus TaxID=61819 RepID=A0A3Q0R7I6_AMPCI